MQIWPFYAHCNWANRHFMSFIVTLICYCICHFFEGQTVRKWEIERVGVMLASPIKSQIKQVMNQKEWDSIKETTEWNDQTGALNFCREGDTNNSWTYLQSTAGSATLKPTCPLFWMTPSGARPKRPNSGPLSRCIIHLSSLHITDCCFIIDAVLNAAQVLLWLCALLPGGSAFVSSVHRSLDCCRNTSCPSVSFLFYLSYWLFLITDA